MVTIRFGTALLALVLLLAGACSQSEGGSVIGSEDPQQTQLPKIKVNLPPPPSFQKEHAPEMFPDSSYSVYGLRKNIKSKINTKIRVKGFLLEVYECPECPQGTDCKACRKPHLWISDRANGPKEKSLLVTDYPKEDPETKKATEWQVGGQYYVNGIFSKTSGTGFSASDGLLIFSDAQLVGGAE